MKEGHRAKKPVKQLHSTLERLAARFASRKVIVAIVLLFVLGASWIAVSSRYPMAFDEDYHLGNIQIYTKQWLPFMGEQPLSSDHLGAVVGNPSYLYHYVMSFPYRAIATATDNFMVQIITLRLINVAIFVFGIWVWYKALAKTGISRTQTHLIFLLFSLTSVMLQVAGQINYDSAVFVASGAMVWLTIDILSQLKKHRLDAPRIVAFVSVGMVACLIKYPLAPLFATILVYMGIESYRNHTKSKKLLQTTWQTWQTARRSVRVVLLIGLALTGILFAERYGLNTVRYQTPIPECDQVLGVERCQEYKPWKRNYDFAQQKSANFTPNPIDFVLFWTRRMPGNLIFMLNGPSSEYSAAAPLIVPRLAFYGLIVIGLLCWFRFRRELNRLPFYRLLFVISLVYVVVLFAQNFSEYTHLGAAVAVQGRYLLPVLLPLVWLAIRSTGYALRTRRTLQLALATTLAVAYLAGGGLLVFLVRTDASWYWEQAHITTINQRAQSIVRLIIPGV